MRFESEIVSDEILPAIRKIIADRLQNDYGYTQEEIAAKLDVTQPAVSQYLKGKRSDSDIVEKLKGDPQINILLDDTVSNAAKNRNFSSEIREIITTSRDKGIFKKKFEDAERAL